MQDVEDPRSGLELWPHMTRDVGSSSFVQYHSGTLLSYVGCYFHRQVRLGSRAGMQVGCAAVTETVVDKRNCGSSVVGNEAVTGGIGGMSAAVEADNEKQRGSYITVEIARRDRLERTWMLGVEGHQRCREGLRKRQKENRD